MITDPPAKQQQPSIATCESAFWWKHSVCST